MKAMQCEMCNSHDLVKQDGVYICQSCGTKYSVEEARKLIIEGSVDVSGSTVKVDNSDLAEKYLVNARRAVQKKDWKDTEKYYGFVEEYDPSNFEAIFYSSFGKAMQSLSDSDLTDRRSAFQAFHNCFTFVYDNYSLDKDPDISILREMTSNTILMFGSSFKYNQTKNGYGTVVSDDRAQTIALFKWICSDFALTLKTIAAKYKSDPKSVTIFKLAITMYEFSMKAYNVLYPEIKDDLLACHNEITRMDSSHEIPDYEANYSKQQLKGKIYAAIYLLIIVATIVGIILILK